MNELISIIVPIYNVEKYLEKCIESLLNQTYKNIEILLIDDGATDRCPQICDKYMEKDKRIKVIHKDNGGLSDARNVGIEIANGKYIGFVDSDDYVEKDMYEFLYKNIKENNADIAICGRYINNADGRQIIDANPNLFIIMDTKEALINLNSYKGFDMSACDKIYKKELFENIRFPFGKKCEDYYTMYKVFDKANKIIYNSNPKYHYFQRENSISRNSYISNAYIEASLSQLEFFKKNHPDIEYTARTSYVFANIAQFNKYVNYNIICPKNIKEKLKYEVRKNIKYIVINKNISKFKKMQAYIFSFNINIYKYIYLLMKNRK